MLVLTRRINETVMINENIKVTVLDVNGQQVRLGFEAPKEVTVHREEIFDRIQEEKARVNRLDETSRSSSGQ